MLTDEVSITERDIIREYPELYEAPRRKTRNIGAVYVDPVEFETVAVDDELGIYIQKYIDGLNDKNIKKYSGYVPHCESMRNPEKCKYIYFHGSDKGAQCNNKKSRGGLCDHHHVVSSNFIEPILKEEVILN